MKYIRLYISVFLLIILILGCSNRPGENENVTITISAAASLKDALSDIQTMFEKEHSNIELLLNFGGSGSLQQQIKQGAPVDFFISAAEKPFLELVNEELIDTSHYSNIIGNKLVFITPKESKIESLNAIKDAKKIALGTPESVPAGYYAKQALTSYGFWETVNKKIVMAKDVRQVLTYVETGNVDAGFVYNTDAQGSDKVNIVEEIGEDFHDPIVYPAGIVKSSKNKEEALLFYQFLQSDTAQKIFKNYGFRVLE